MGRASGTDRQLACFGGQGSQYSLASSFEVLVLVVCHLQSWASNIGVFRISPQLIWTHLLTPQPHARNDWLLKAILTKEEAL